MQVLNINFYKEIYTMDNIGSNWSAVFKDAAGNAVFATGGHESEMTMNIKTEDTFVNLALVQLSKMDQFGDLPEGLSIKSGWDKLSVDAAVFGITGHEVARADVDDQKIRLVERNAWDNNFYPPIRTL